MEHTLEIRTVGIVTGESFILILHKAVIVIKIKFFSGIFGALLELYADTVAFIGNAGLSGVDSYASIVLVISFLFFHHSCPPYRLIIPPSL